MDKKTMILTLISDR